MIQHLIRALLPKPARFTHTACSARVATAPVSFSTRPGKSTPTFPDGSELVEEYDAETHRITCKHRSPARVQEKRQLRHLQHSQVRKRRRPTATGAAAEWEVLLGDTQKAATTPAAAAASGLMLQESSANPHCVRVDTPGCFTWTITNLHYPGDTYSVRLDADGTAIVVSTANKKYYKKLDMPEMKLLQLVAEPSRLSWSHQGSTLTIHYSQPPAMLAEELADAKAAAVMRAQEAPADCRQQ